MFGLGVPELMVILVIALVIFGPSKLPQIGSGLGKAIRDFKKGVTEKDDEEANVKKDGQDLEFGRSKNTGDFILNPG
jgi:sec-independent protein translocase protein TatA